MNRVNSQLHSLLVLSGEWRVVKGKWKNFFTHRSSLITHHWGFYG
jgi:hypothetical protein